jgi:hypothetical protein
MRAYHGRHRDVPRDGILDAAAAGCSGAATSAALHITVASLLRRNTQHACGQRPQSPHPGSSCLLALASLLPSCHPPPGHTATIIYQLATRRDIKGHNFRPPTLPWMRLRMGSTIERSSTVPETAPAPRSACRAAPSPARWPCGRWLFTSCFSQACSFSCGGASGHRLYLIL